jgi:hypothetical protein
MQGKKEEAREAIQGVIVLMLEEEARDVRAMHHMTALGGLDIYNILTGEELTINELVKEVKGT